MSAPVFPGSIRRIAAAFAACAALFAGAASAQQFASLDQLLEKTRDARLREQAELREREQRFIGNRNRQAELLEEARSRWQSATDRSAELAAEFDANEQRITELSEQLEGKSGTLGELFGVVRQTAADVASVLKDSMISAEFPGRDGLVSELAQSRVLPSIEQLERLWYEMQREMTEAGRVARFATGVIAPDGSESDRAIVRVGPFTASSDGAFLTYLPESGRFAELTRQPPGRYRKAAETLAAATSGYAPAVVDPTRGSLLAVLVQRPGFVETVEAGGIVGYVIIALACGGLLLGLVRLLRLMEVSAAVARQRKQLDRPFDNNPLGRVLRVYYENPEAEREALELRLEEAVLKEVPRLEAGLGAIKILAAVGPLLGLLGTVTGMIITFQQITLFGTGDPKLMAGGISQALVTTVMGIVMAIPLLLLHGFLSSRSGDLVHMLEEETAGIIAEQAERSRARASSGAQ